MKKRKDGRYQLTVTDYQGKRHFVYGRTVKETEAKAAELRTQLNGGVVLNKNITIAELAEMWLHLEKESEMKPQSFYMLKLIVNKMNGYIGNVKVRDLTAAHVEAMKKGIVGEGQDVTFNAVLTNLRQLLNFGIRHDYVLRNVTAGMRSVKASPKAVKRALTPFELRAIEGADLPPQDRLMVDLLRYSGMRRGELLALDVGDIDLVRHEVTISKMLVAQLNVVEDGSKTAAGIRVIPLPSVFFERNGDYLASRHPSEPVLMTSAYRRICMAAFQRRFLKAMFVIFHGKIPEGITPHTFRHNYASELYSSGIMRDDLKAAQYVLGHTDIHTTMNTYTHFNKEQIDRSRIDAFYQPVVKKMSKDISDTSKMA